jgi:hypothetical protein
MGPETESQELVVWVSGCLSMRQVSRLESNYEKFSELGDS